MSRTPRKPPPVPREGEYDDNPEWTELDFARATYFPKGMKITDLTSEILDAVSARSRGVQVLPKKVPISIRLSRDIIDHFKKDGPGWQTRIDQALRAIVNADVEPAATKTRMRKAAKLKAS